MFKVFVVDRNLFSSFTPKNGGFVSYGDNNKGRVVDSRTVNKYPNPMIEDVLLVTGLKHKLLSIRHLCDKGNEVIFYSSV